MDKLIFLRIIPKFILKVKDEELEILFFKSKNWPKYTAFCHLFIVY